MDENYDYKGAAAWRQKYIRIPRIFITLDQSLLRQS